MNAELRYHIYKNINTGMSLRRHVTVKSHDGLAVNVRQQLATKGIYLYSIFYEENLQTGVQLKKDIPKIIKIIFTAFFWSSLSGLVYELIFLRLKR